MNTRKYALEKITNFKIFISQSKSEIKIVWLGINNIQRSKVGTYAYQMSGFSGRFSES